MDSRDQPPLNWQASDASNPTVSSTLPPEVVECLRSARFLHLATASNTHPHISLMSYTYLPVTPFSASPTIIMTTNPSSRKTSHLLSNPHVSILVHDWVSSRTGTASSPERTRRPSSSLASMLLGLNSAELGRISCTITGTARVLQAGGEEERWCKLQHVESHGFMGESAVEDEVGDGDGERQAGGADGGTGAGTGGGSGGFLQGEDVRVVVVKVIEGRIADWKGGVKDFVIREEALVNGV